LSCHILFCTPHHFLWPIAEMMTRGFLDRKNKSRSKQATEPAPEKTTENPTITPTEIPPVLAAPILTGKDLEDYQICRPIVNWLKLVMGATANNYFQFVLKGQVSSAKALNRGWRSREQCLLTANTALLDMAKASQEAARTIHRLHLASSSSLRDWARIPLHDGSHDPLSGLRIGEASHPGPGQVAQGLVRDAMWVVFLRTRSALSPLLDELLDAIYAAYGEEDSAAFYNRRYARLERRRLDIRAALLNTRLPRGPGSWSLNRPPALVTSADYDTASDGAMIAMQDAVSAHADVRVARAEIHALSLDPGAHSALCARLSIAACLMFREWSHDPWMAVRIARAARPGPLLSFPIQPQGAAEED
jgi:hypothetical protein